MSLTLLDTLMGANGKAIKIFLLFVITASAGVALATTPIDDLPEPAAVNTSAQTVTEVLADPLAEDEAPQIKIEPMTAKMDEASEVKPYDEKNLPKEKLPEPKSEVQKLGLMFLKVMLAAAFCAVIIYLLLLFVRKFFADKIIANVEGELQDNLKSSQTDSEALKTFLNRTKNH